MKLVSRHGNGKRHREWTGACVTRDPWTFLVPPGSSVTEADGRSWSSPYPVVAIFWPERYYQVFMLLKADTTDYYCNIIAPPVYSPEEQQVSFVDLDLDVVVNAGGVHVLDEAEFAERQSDYPALWVAEAKRSVAELAALASAQQGPFAPATALRWRVNVQVATGE